MTDHYPNAICHACGTDRGTHQRISTYHAGVCGWCGEQRPVTEPRDYGYPPYQAEAWTVERAE